MFKIARASLAESFSTEFPELEGCESDAFARYTVSEGWVGDLSNGVIKLGERATLLHGLNTPECGLLSMMRCYDPNDRAHILELFEQAATSSSHFCYSTTIGLPNGHRQPVFCVGESDGLEHSSAGRMLGLFVFPRFKLAASTHLRALS